MESFGIEFDDDDFRCSEPVEEKTVTYEKPTVVSILKNFKSGIGLDIAKNHTGIVYWDGSELHTYGFLLSEYDSKDYFAEYKMRREFKQKLAEIVKGKFFELCIVEDVYGGDNFDTVRKLLALNTVMDELIFDGVCSVDTFVRWKQVMWAAKTRLVYRQKGKPKSKIETQNLMEFLEFDFYEKYKDYPETEKESKAKGLPTKKELFFEDICDACGMLLGLAIAKLYDNLAQKPKKVSMSDIKLIYIDYLDDPYRIPDKRVQDEGYIVVDFNYRNIEEGVKQEVMLHPNDVICAEIPPSKLGAFGLKHKLNFYTEGEGYLLFYNKKGKVM